MPPLSPSEANERSPLVSVVIPCFNQAEYLAEAIESVRSQTYPSFEIIVVNDGSTDSTAEVCRRSAGVHYVEQRNQGLAAARNRGWKESRGELLAFLDADDRLMPGALDVGVASLSEHPEWAFVSGGHRRIEVTGAVSQCPDAPVVEGDPYLEFLRGNYIGMHAAVLYRRDSLVEAGGFDPSLSACEDYDLYLRLSREHPVGCHTTVVAEYRGHEASMSADAARMLRASLQVLGRQRVYIRGDRAREEALDEGERLWKDYYGKPLRQSLGRLLAEKGPVRALKAAAVLAAYAPQQFEQGMRHQLVRFLPAAALRALARVRGQPWCPPPGRVRWGDLRRLEPVSRVFGFDRGLPVDRHYIERFLAAHAGSIRGRVLEVGDDAYTRRFGAERVVRADVLHGVDGNSRATFVADLAAGEELPSQAFDCVILTQTLHLVFDLKAAVSTLYRILKPGGVLLLTVPGISQRSTDEWRDRWCWSLTTCSARRLFEAEFGAEWIEVAAHGNVLAAVAFLEGVATEELQASELDLVDPQYEVLVTVKATRPRDLKIESIRDPADRPEGKQAGGWPDSAKGGGPE